MYPVISRTLTSRIDFLLTSLMPSLRSEILQGLANLWLVPIAFGLVVFLIRIRKGYAIHGASLNPVFLPQPFREAIEYVRETQDRGQQKKTNNEDSSVEKLE
jgi:hypothetical protein